MPWIYCWGWFLKSSTSSSVSKPINSRLLLMTGLASVWGLRLSWNFWKKGGYSGGEDYRWAVVRKWYPGWKWEVFNLIFICFFQQVCVFAFSVPAVAALQSDEPLNMLDVIAAA